MQFWPGFVNFPWALVYSLFSTSEDTLIFSNFCKNQILKNILEAFSSTPCYPEYSSPPSCVYDAPQHKCSEDCQRKNIFIFLNVSLKRKIIVWSIK